MAFKGSVEIRNGGAEPAQFLDADPFLLPADIRAMGGHAYVYGTGPTFDWGFDLIQDSITGTRTVPDPYAEPAFGFTPIAADTYLDFPATSSQALFETNNAMTLWAAVKPVQTDGGDPETLTVFDQQWAISDGPGFAGAATNACIALGVSNDAAIPRARLSLRTSAGTQIVNATALVPGGKTEPNRWCLMLAWFTLTQARVVIYRNGTRAESNLNTRTSSVPGSARAFRTGYAWATPQDLPVVSSGFALDALSVAQQDALYARYQRWFAQYGELI